MGLHQHKPIRYSFPAQKELGAWPRIETEEDVSRKHMGQERRPAMGMNGPALEFFFTGRSGAPIYQ